MGKHAQQVRLRHSQLQLLEVVYQYRFISRQLVAARLGLPADGTLFKRLEILVAHGYIAKHYSPEHRLNHTPTIYYVTPAGIRLLAALPNHSPVRDSTLLESYRDQRQVGRALGTHTLHVHRQTYSFTQHHTALTVYLPRLMRAQHSLPERLPDALLVWDEAAAQPKRSFWFDLIDVSCVPRDLANKLYRYRSFLEELYDDASTKYVPIILLLCEQRRTEVWVQRTARRQLYYTATTDMQIYTAVASLLNPAPPIEWTDVTEPDVHLTLDQLCQP